MLNRKTLFKSKSEKTPIIESCLFSQYSKQKLKCISETYHELAGLYKNIPVNSTFGQREEYLRYMQMNETRQLFSKNLEEISDAVSDVADTMIQVTLPVEHKRRMLVRFLRKHGVVVRDVVFMDGVGCKGNFVDDNGKNSYFDNRISICARLIKGYILSANELAGLLSDFFDRRLVVSLDGARTLSRYYNTLIFEDEPKYTMLSAVSRAVKEGEKISGDNFSIEEYNQNQMIMMVADGMGSGEQACNDSQSVIEFMERFLEAGFGKEKAVEMVNNAFVSQNECCNLTTLDICSINMLTGEADFIKAGAAQSYIKRGEEIIEIDTGTLPIGSMSELGILTTSLRLFEADMVIMLSDGVRDAIELNDADIKNIISKCRYDNPKEFSEYLLHYAINCNKGRVHDDMTILVTRHARVG